MVSNSKQNELINLGFRVPRWMLKAIREVQLQMQRETPEKVIKRSDAARRVLFKGLEALGIDLENTETEEAET